MTKNLLVEGWRRSSHSYALVNQHQLLHLCRDPRFSVFHTDIAFYRPEWAQVDAGMSSAARQKLDSLPHPGLVQPDVIYRISWPLRVHRGNAPRVFVFGTSELQRLKPEECCGPSGTCADVDKRVVEIITPSRWSRGGFLESGFEERQVHVIPHAVDPDLFRAADADEKRKLRASLQIPQNAQVFLNIGAMTWNKGIGPLLAAFSLYWQRNPGAILLLKGGDELYGNLMSSCCADAARFVPGGVPQAVLRAIRYSGRNLSALEVARLYRVSDAYVSPYRAEGFNLPVLEALASGLTPVVTAGGSTDDFCPDHLSVRIASTLTALNDGGRFLEPDVESLVACMARAIEDRSLRDRVAIEGPRWAADRYSWARVSQLLADRLSV